MCARTSSAVGKGGVVERGGGGDPGAEDDGGRVVGFMVGMEDVVLVDNPAAVETGRSGESARELVVEPLGEVWVFGMPSFSLMRLRVPSDISPPEPARPSLSLPEPAVLRERFWGTAEVDGWREG